MSLLPDAGVVGRNCRCRTLTDDLKLGGMRVDRAATLQENEKEAHGTLLIVEIMGGVFFSKIIAAGYRRRRSGAAETASLAISVAQALR